MVKIIKLASLFSFLLLYGFDEVNAQSYSVRGVGQTTCESFLSNINSDNGQNGAALYAQWLAGYITAKNVSMGALDAFPIREPLMEWVKAIALVCSVNTDKRLAEVSDGLLTALKPYLVSGDDAVVPIALENGKTISVYRNYLVSAQTFLRGKGYRVAADGIFGERTSNAFRNYKKDNNIAGSAGPDVFFLISMID